VTQLSLPAARRVSWLPSLRHIGANVLELRRRCVLMTVTVVFTVGVPVIFCGIREIAHLVDPAHYGAAGGTDALKVVTLMAEFGFILAVVLGASAGTDDLNDGMFRQFVITGRSKLSLYLARIPAGLSILLPLAAVGYTVTALVTAFLNTPHAPGESVPSAGQLAAVLTECGLWFELYLIIGFTVGLGLAVLMGQRTVPVVLLIVWEIILTPALADHVIPHFVNVQRLIIGVAMYQLQPAVLGGGVLAGQTGGTTFVVPPMPTWAMAGVIAGWTICWLAIGAWKMATRDA
jgi:hypothetical protein